MFVEYMQRLCYVLLYCFLHFYLTSLQASSFQCYFLSYCPVASERSFNIVLWSMELDPFISTVLWKWIHKDAQYCTIKALSHHLIEVLNLCTIGVTL